MNNKAIVKTNKKGPEGFPDLPSSWHHLTTLVAACLLALPYAANAQTSETTTSLTTTIDKLYVLGHGRQSDTMTVTTETKENTPNYASSADGNPVGAWVNGGKFTDNAANAMIGAPTLFQVGGNTRYPAGSDEPFTPSLTDNFGGRIDIKGLYTGSPDSALTIAVIGSSVADSVFSAGFLNSWIGTRIREPDDKIKAPKYLDIYIDGLRTPGHEPEHATGVILGIGGDLEGREKASFILQNSGFFETGKHLNIRMTALPDPSENKLSNRFLIVNNWGSKVESGNWPKEGIRVKGGSFFLYNRATPLTDIAQESDEALIKNSNVYINENFVLQGDVDANGQVIKNTFLQIINDPGVDAKLSAAKYVMIKSNADGNTTTLLLGRGAKVETNELYVRTYKAGAAATLMLGDTSSTDADYGVKANGVHMEGPGTSKILFNNAHRGESAETASFPILGKGTVEIQTGRTIFTQNSKYEGTTVIHPDTSLILKTPRGAGFSTVSIHDNGELIYSGVKDYIRNEITGAGRVIFADNAKMSMYKDGHWTGETLINDATLSIGSPSKPVHLSSGSVTISPQGMLWGFGSIKGSLNNKRYFMVGGTSDAAKTAFEIGGDLTNSGHIWFNNWKVAGSTLTVKGNYSGNNGLISFNGVLNGDNDSVVDKLVVEGDTDGYTRVKVNRLGGSGAQTVRGIELIRVGGNSKGIFRQAGPIVSGAYEYILLRGDTPATKKNWYLKTFVPNLTVDLMERPNTILPPETSETPDTPATPAAPDAPNTSNTTDKVVVPDTPKHPDISNEAVSPRDETPLYRPEAGAYIGNSAVVQSLFSTRLHDRIGDLWYGDPQAGEDLSKSVWIKQRGNYNSWRESSGQLRNRTQMYATQLGGHVHAWTSDGANRFLVGWVAGYGHGRTKSHSIYSGRHAVGTVNGLNLGLTGTWYQNGTSRQGMYVDTWLTYGWFDNKVNGEGLKAEKYHSRGLTGSVETGYTLKLSEFTTEKGTDMAWYLQPQAQVIWSGVKTDNFHEDNGTKIKTKGRNSVQTRLGARALLDINVNSYTKGTDGTQLFVEGNWIHNTKSNGVEMGSTTLTQKGARNLGEVKLGLNGKLTRNLHMWANASARAGTDHYRDLTGMIGVKYSF